MRAGGEGVRIPATTASFCQEFHPPHPPPLSPPPPSNSVTYPKCLTAGERGRGEGVFIHPVTSTHRLDRSLPSPPPTRHKPAYSKTESLAIPRLQERQSAWRPDFWKANGTRHPLQPPSSKQHKRSQRHSGQ